jgi:uncharacterized membrane protein
MDLPPQSSSSANPPRSPGEMSGILRDNIAKMTEMRRVAQEQRDRQTRIADAITGFTGSMRSVWFHLLLFGGWIVINTGLVPGVRPFDRFPFVMLAMFASVEAIFLSTFVLISQNRAAALTSRRDELDVQVNLIAEHEITRAIQMLDAIMTHFDIRARPGDLEALKQDVPAENIVREIERVERAQAPGHSRG